MCTFLKTHQVGIPPVYDAIGPESAANCKISPLAGLYFPYTGSAFKDFYGSELCAFLYLPPVCFV